MHVRFVDGMESNAFALCTFVLHVFLFFVFISEYEKFNLFIASIFGNGCIASVCLLFFILYMRNLCNT